MKNRELKMRLKLFKNGEMVYDTTLRIKRKILPQLERVPHDKSYICVTYPDGNINDSNHFDDESLKKALNDYTAQSQVDFVMGKERRVK